ncbi:HDOD domain-containing protein [Silvimonas sp.]|uniref:HDOD domain-containing protein n=1 Tax=Silvimonas sp. TaxID=2650811 RepID=UPI0028420F14|nr:HDOD domain-containing protein [Silvimonas sp.]MDR3429194.1 HDOD domain-containing protein [Silvimonas sp.]
MPTSLQNRFQLLRELGTGSQGKVWLAHDSKTQREVVLRVGAVGDIAAVGLKHAGLVPLLECTRFDEQSALVYKYEQGSRLSEQHFSIALAVDLVIDLLDALAVLHEAGLTHGHVTAHNILLDTQQKPRLLDIGTGRGLAADDVHAVGALFYMILTGQTAAPGANQPRPELDAALDQLLMSALQPRPPAAAALRDALRNWRGDSTPMAEGAPGTLEFLLRRMRHTSDFPALSQAIGAINKINEGDAERLQVLSGVILNDFSLVNKLLRLVNSASYGQFGGTISTISRAIVILGFDAIRNLAITLLLFEHMHNKAHAAQLRDAVLQAFFGGLLARQIALECGARDAEESLICGMFHHLGRLLTVYYFPEEQREITRRIQSGMSEESAAIAVLGMSWDELGIGVARHWLFPERIVNAMRPLPDGMMREPASTLERLRVYANLSARLVPLVGAAPVKLNEPVRLFGTATGLDFRGMQQVMKAAGAALMEQLGAIGVDAHHSVFLQTLLRGEGAEQSADVMDDLVLTSATQTAGDAAAVLSAGVQDITQALVSNFALNDVLRMILETMYRGIGFERVLLCTRDAKKPMILARFGFGNDVNSVIPRFQMDTTQKGDVFQVTLERNLDVLIDDIDAPSIAARVPQWYRQQVAAATFMLFPIKVGDRVLGFFYGDKTVPGSITVGSNELNLLKTLRNQAVLAIRTKQSGS